MGGSVAFWVVDTTIVVSTLTLVACPVKPVSLPPEISPHGMSFDIF